MAVSFLVLVGTLYMFVTIPKGFIPDQDTDQLQIYTEAAQGTSYYQMMEYEQQIAKTVAANPNVESLMADRKSTRLNSSHLVISYAVFCLKKKTKKASRTGGS